MRYWGTLKRYALGGQDTNMPIKRSLYALQYLLVALGSLMLFPMNFLRSMGMGGIAAVLVAMLAALTTLPALLSVVNVTVVPPVLPSPEGRRAGAVSPAGVSWSVSGI